MSVAPPLDRLGVQLHAEDNVLVATRDLQVGDSAGAFVLRASVPGAHKVAVAPIAEGEPVRKYNQSIGAATTPIAPAAHVHTERLAFQYVDRPHAFGADVVPTRFVPDGERATF